MVKSIEYVLISVDIINEDEINGNKHKSIIKCGNQMVEILAKLKSWNLPISKSENLFKGKKVQNVDIIKKSNFLTLNNKTVFTKLR